VAVGSLSKAPGERRRDLKAGCFIKAHLYQTGVKVDP